jgi:predicted outer membrane repeat protein
VKISGLRLINGDGGINNYAENLTVENCQFLNGNASETGGDILNRNILTVDSCLFENNSATFGGGAISNDAQEANLIVRNSNFLNNHYPIGGGAIANVGILE